MKRISLITGGARSGKSSHALALARAQAKDRLYFVATAEPLDDEMAARIARHRAVRPNDIVTIEEPREVSAAMSSLEGQAELVIVDCLTLWVSNLMGAGASDEAILAEARKLADVLARASFSSIVVTDEVGAGIVPEHPLGRRFRDLLGWANQAAAAVADEVILMVAGCPVRVK
jgi:adenosylcobinamide kinase / adenosylcobinamide-phosphate guanylyltransferase